jgi:DNA replication protein DnaC
MEQTDIALANTLDTLMATGASAGGATALAQAALQSKKNIAANIEQQEAQNEKLRAQGEQALQAQKISEQQRLQSIAISEGQRVQAADAAGKQFEFQTQDNRINADLDRAAGMQAQAQANQASANQAQASAITGAVGGITGMLGTAVGGGAF